MARKRRAGEEEANGRQVGIRQEANEEREIIKRGARGEQGKSKGRATEAQGKSKRGAREQMARNQRAGKEQAGRRTASSENQNFIPLGALPPPMVLHDDSEGQYTQSMRLQHILTPSSQRRNKNEIFQLLFPVCYFPLSLSSPY
jgi:hypothetical protein